MFYFARFRWLLRPDISRDKPNPISVASASNPGVPTGSAEAPRLKRVLGLWDLIVYGIIIVQIVAPVPIAGLLEQRSNGHAVTTGLIALAVLSYIGFDGVSALAEDVVNPKRNVVLATPLLFDYREKLKSP
jgi:amino acid transporter